MSRDPHTPLPPQPDGSPLPPVAGEGGFSQQPSRLLLEEIMVYVVFIVHIVHMYR